MDITLLEYFQVVAKTQHMTKAAQQLNISQPSLSTAIRRLESELGMPLFDRIGRNIQLNEYGVIFYKGVSAALQDISTAIEEMESRKRNKASLVRLACSRSPSNSKLIDSLLSKGIGLKINTVPPDWERQLLEQTCDLVITVGLSHSSEIEHYPLRQQKLVIVSSKEHPLANTPVVRAEELNCYPFCSTDSPHSLVNVAKPALSSLNIFPHITFWGQNSEDMLKAIYTGQFLGLMVQHNLPKDHRLVQLTVESFDIALPIYLYWNKRTSNVSAVAVSRQEIIDSYQTISLSE